MPTSRRAAYLRGLLLALAGSVFFSAKAVVAKLRHREVVDAVRLIALRMLLPLPVFLTMSAVAGGSNESLSRHWLAASAARIMRGSPPDRPAAACPPTPKSAASPTSSSSRSHRCF